MTDQPTHADTVTLTRERADLLESLARQRHFLRHPTHGLSEEQVRLSPTASELSLGGLIKHVAATEESWVDFIRGTQRPEPDVADWLGRFRLEPDETLTGVLAAYEEASRRTDQVVAEEPDLDRAIPLPEAPWFEPGAEWTVRRVLLHLIAEIAQHAGHADIIRETIDGAKSMG